LRAVAKEKTPVRVRLATLTDVDAVKRIADECRIELGFHTRQSFLESIEKEALLVAFLGDLPSGFLRFHHTRAGYTTLREVASAENARGRGIGQALVEALISESRSKNSALFG